MSKKIKKFSVKLVKKLKKYIACLQVFVSHNYFLTK